MGNGRPRRAWGTADPGEKVNVTVAGKSAETVAGPDGAWRVDLPAMMAGGPHEMTVKGGNALVLKNVLVGEVWICSGQSNMAMSVSRCLNGKEEAAGADLPQVRLFTVRRRSVEAPAKTLSGHWAVCSPKTVPGFSGVGFFFGRAVHEARGVPVGLINTSWAARPPRRGRASTRLGPFRGPKRSSPHGTIGWLRTPLLLRRTRRNSPSTRPR